MSRTIVQRKAAVAAADFPADMPQVLRRVVAEVLLRAALAIEDPDLGVARARRVVGDLRSVGRVGGLVGVGNEQPGGEASVQRYSFVRVCQYWSPSRRWALPR